MDSFYCLVEDNKFHNYFIANSDLVLQLYNIITRNKEFEFYELLEDPRSLIKEYELLNNRLLRIHARLNKYTTLKWCGRLVTLIEDDFYRYGIDACCVYYE